MNSESLYMKISLEIVANAMKLVLLKEMIVITEI